MQTSPRTYESGSIFAQGVEANHKLNGSRFLSLGLSEPAPTTTEEIRVPDFEGFRGCILPPSKLGWSLSASTLIHGFLVPFLAIWSSYLSRLPQEEAVHLVKQDPLFYQLPAATPIAKPPLAGGGQARLAPRRAEGALKKDGLADGAFRVTDSPFQRRESVSVPKMQRLATRNFELPPQAPRADVEQTILIPQLPPEATKPEKIRLPNVAFWSQTSPTLPRRPVRQFITPGRQTEPAPAPPKPIAPPALEAPNRETNISDIKMTGGVAPKKMPILVRAPSTTMPVQVIGPPPDTPSTNASMDLQKGEPVNLITLNMNPGPPSEVISVPSVNQVGRLPAAGSVTAAGGETGVAEGPGTERTGAASGSAAARGSGGAARGEGSGSGGPGSSDARGQAGGVAGGTGPTVAGARSGVAGGAGLSGSGRTGSAGSGAGSSSANGSGSGNGAGGGRGSGTGSGSGAGGGSGTGTGAGIGTGAGGGFTGAGVASATADAPGRMVHPKGGVFDMVVVQTSAADSSTEDSKLLTGKPIYTVYLRVGTPKEWILRYCIPKTGTKSTGSVIQLTAPAPVAAPYPWITLTPPMPILARKVRTVLHGFLNSEGTFRGLAVVKPEDAEYGAAVAPFLQQWEFRPATRDGRPIEVEVVLVIPALEI